MNRAHRGFTLVEMMVIAPIVILLIGSFIALIVNLTGEVLSSRGSNSLTYEIQDTLNRIEDDVKLSTGYLAVNSISLASTKQGYGTDKNNGSTINFTNITKPGGSSASLIINGLVTNGNPLSTTTNLIYLANKPNGCGNISEFSSNTPMTMNVVYFVDENNVLWRRTIMPSDYNNASIRCGNAAAWQQPSCIVGYNPTTMPFCKTNDIRLLDGVSPTDFTVEYFASTDSLSPDSTAGNSAITDDTVRNTALRSTPTINVSITSRKNIAGRDITGTGSIRATRLDTNASAIAVESAPTAVPALPNVSAQVVDGSNVTFTWPRVSEATSYRLEFRINSGSWQSNSSTTDINNNTRSYTVTTANHTDTVEARVRAVNSFGNSAYSTSSITIPLWAPLILGNGWSDYEQGYSTAAYTKTSTGFVLLKGLVKKSSAVASGETIAEALPPAYRPAGGRVIFPAMSDPNSWGRVDILDDGRVILNDGRPGWVSLENVAFMAASAPYTRASPALLNGWVNYGSGYAPVSYVQDSIGRVSIQGLVKSGTIADGTPVFTLPGTMASSLFMHIGSNAASTGQSLIGVGSNVQAKGRGSNGFLAMTANYFPSSASITWNNISLLNGWSNYNATLYPGAQYAKSSDGIVHLRGLIKSGTTGGSIHIGTLPASFRPKARTLMYSISNGEQARVDIINDGQIVVTTAHNSWLSLDGLSFVAEQ